MKSSGTWRSWATPRRANCLRRVPTFILQENLYGVDLSPEAVEITQLALWIRSASRASVGEALGKYHSRQLARPQRGGPP